MFIDHLEKNFQRLGLPPERPRLLLSIPLVACLSADGAISRFEARAVEDFARDTLDFDSSQMRFLHGWLLSPPDESTVRDALGLIETLVKAKDMVTIETQTMSTVFLQCDRLLRLREIARESDAWKGRQLLRTMTERFGVHLGVPWQEVAPEVFEEETDERGPQTKPVEKKELPLRRWKTALRQQTRSRRESGGII
jgi:hypothetical protein